jgi:hypothetical protein
MTFTSVNIQFDNHNFITHDISFSFFSLWQPSLLKEHFGGTPGYNLLELGDLKLRNSSHP